MATPVALHYFRLARPAWELMLTRMRQLGADTIYAPVPWGFHEFAAGKFDLTGLTNPRRDLAGFVELCAAMGFAVVLDLSPVPGDADLLNGGLPGWLLTQHPEIRAQNKRGEFYNTPTWEHPTLLKFLGRWWQTLAQTLLSNRSANATLQVQVNLSQQPLDFNDHVATVRWPIWLRKRYAEGGVEALNTAYAPPTPFHNISQVKLTASLEAAAFQADVQAFTTETKMHALETYQSLLKEQGWPLADPIAPPPHGVQIPNDPADVGASFRWAMQAPVKADGTPTPAFWATKEQNALTWLTTADEQHQILITPPEGNVTFEFAAEIAAYRLLLTGNLQPVKVNTGGGTYTFTAVANDSDGQTDFYFTLPTAATPLEGFLAKYLGSLLQGQQHALLHAGQLIHQLDSMLQPPAAPAAAPTPPPGLSEAQAALTEANRALQRAAQSVGLLEEVFATSLNKAPAINASLPFLALDIEKLHPVKTTCTTALDALGKMSNAPLSAPFTMEQYTTAHQNIITLATQIVDAMENTLIWLRENLATGNLSTSAWSIHAQIESVLQLLTNGVL